MLSVVVGVGVGVVGVGVGEVGVGEVGGDKVSVGVDVDEVRVEDEGG